MRILKFGGSSLKTPERVRSVAKIVAGAAKDGAIAVVVSAFGGVTDDLLDVAHGASRHDDGYRDVLTKLEKRHRDAAAQLSAPGDRPALDAHIDAIFREIEEIAHGAFMVREASPRTVDRIVSAGERLSAAITAACFRADGMDAAHCDARRLIVTGSEFGNAQVRADETTQRVREHFSQAMPLQVITGFVAATADGETTTLGRGGSDYTASLIGAALDAEAVELWTDVDGVMSADPRIVPDAISMRTLSYEELMELSHFGAKVVHPPSVHPTRSKSIPLRIKNTFRPEAVGTEVTNSVVAAGEDSPPVVGVASIRSVALLRLEGDGMVGVPGIAMRLFGALTREGVSVILISQASSEHSICLAVAPDVVELAARGIEQEFAAERRAGFIDDVVIERDLSIVAVVGAGMRERAGVAGRLFGVLGRHGVNVRAIAQGSSELNISLVVESKDEKRVVQMIHDAFFLPGWAGVDLFVAGVGRVGAVLLEQIAAQREMLEKTRGFRLRLVGLADSRGALLNRNGLDPVDAAARLKSGESLASHDDLIAAARQDRGAVRILVDCTASDRVPHWYLQILESRGAVVAANKLPLAGSLSDYRQLVNSAAGRLYHESTVGAALPVIRTLNDLLATGDNITRIEGLLSGTLGYVMNEVNDGAAFSDVVRKAHELGFTEPDPREDLGGRDVARKLLILARLSGRDLEPEDVGVESLLPDETWNDGSLEQFWDRLPELDPVIGARASEAAAAGGRLVYLASLDEHGARVALTTVGPDHPGHKVRGKDSVIAFTTDRYSESPLVVQGPGAGPEVTASGVFSDILRAIAES